MANERKKADHTCETFTNSSLLRVVFGVLYSGRLWWFLAHASLSDDGNDDRYV